MVELTDLHCHLLAGLDDGPRNDEDALEMCRIAVGEGIRHVAALAHQSDRWQLSSESIRQSVRRLAGQLAEANIPLAVYPTAEVMADTEAEKKWKEGQLLSVADQRQFLLMEMPTGLFVDLRHTVRQLRRSGVQVLLAHPERHPEFLHESGKLEELIALGCLVQVSTGSITDANGADAKALRDWFRRGCVHVLGTDGHSPRKRKPLMAEAYRRVREWAGADVADQVASGNGIALLRGEPLLVTPPRAVRRWWSFSPW